MDAHRAFARFTSVLLSAHLAFLAFGSTLGCQQSDASASNGPAPLITPSTLESTPLPPKTQSPVNASGQAEYKESAFQLVLTAPSKVEVGKAAVFTIVLTAQGGYKVNEEYPIKFQFSESKGVSPAKQTVTKDDVRLEKTQATMPLTVTIPTPGKHEVSGKFSFSVCTDERCLIEKRDLRVEVNAS
jgi:hypothetical protein